jgi:hypothetical protein
MQKTQTFLVDKKKEEEKVKSGGKFKRLKRDEKRQIGETLPGDIQKKRKSGGEDMDLDELGEVKRSKLGVPVEKEVEVKNVEAGLSEQPCASQ